MKIEYKKQIKSERQERTLYVVQTEKVEMPIPVLEEGLCIDGKFKWQYTIYAWNLNLKHKTDIKKVVKSYINNETIDYDGYCGKWYIPIYD